MRAGNTPIRRVLVLCAGLAVAAAQVAAAGLPIKPLAAGLSYENFSRTVVWKGDEASSRIQAGLISARAEFGLAKGIVVGVHAGLSLTDFKDVSFTTLPISLQYDGSPLKGFALGVDVDAPLYKFSDFEIGGTARFVYSIGMSTTWPLEGFAVEGEARGSSSWMEAAVGPRLSYLFFGRVVPYLEICARWLRADFEMRETLEDLSGAEKKLVRGDLQLSFAIGADAAVTDRIVIEAKAGILPYTGGVNGLASLGVLYKF